MSGSLWTFDYALRKFPAYEVLQPPDQRLEPLLERLHRYHNCTLSLAEGEAKLVCDVSSNYLRLEDAHCLADWLECNSLQLRGLNLAWNLITCASWAEVLQLVNKLQQNVRYIHLGGNRLPPVDEADLAVVAIRESGRVSLTFGGDLFEADRPGAWSPHWEEITNRVEEVMYKSDDECNHLCPRCCRDEY